MGAFYLGTNIILFDRQKLYLGSLHIFMVLLPGDATGPMAAIREPIIFGRCEALFEDPLTFVNIATHRCYFFTLLLIKHGYLLLLT